MQKLQNQAINNFFLTAKKKPDFAIIAPFIQEKIINLSKKNERGI